MRKILLCVLLSVCTISKAQNIADPEKPYDYYCIVFMGNWSKAYISMPSSGAVHAIMNEDFKKKSFNGDTDLLTYMAKHGWQYVEKVTFDGKGAHLMKKSVKNDDDAKGKLILESDVEQKKKD